MKPKTTKYNVDYAILSAMPEELDFFAKEFSNYPCVETRIGEFDFRIYNYKDSNILLASTGIGTTFAASILTLINAHFSPAYVLISGTAGGIKTGLKIKDVIIVETAFEAEIQELFHSLKGTPFESALRHPMKNYYFPSKYLGSPELLNLFHSFDCDDINIHTGTAVSSNAFPAPKELFEKIKQLEPCLIDMETSAFYQTAWLLNIKILAVRGISNILNQDGTDDNIHESDVEGSSRAAASVVFSILNKSIDFKNKVKDYSLKNISHDASQLINHYNLQRHPEGGYFSRNFKSNDVVKILSDRYNDENRQAGSSIYYLLDKDDYSAWHVLKSDELWNYHEGSLLNMHVIDQAGNLTTHLLGNVLENKDATFQICIKAGNYFCAENVDKTTYSLVSCVVIPGFEYGDFKLADKNILIKNYPHHKNIIEKLCHKKSRV